MHGNGTWQEMSRREQRTQTVLPRHAPRRGRSAHSRVVARPRG